MFPAPTNPLTSPVPAWRVALIAVGVGAVLGFAGWSAGRLNALESTSSSAVVVQRFEQRAQERRRRSVDTRTVTTPVLLPTPDGGAVVAAKTETVTTERDDVEKRTDARSELHDEHRSATVSRPDWHIGVMVGATWKEPAVRLGDTPLVLGATVERRVVGPFSVGAWGSTQGAAGLLVSGEF